MRTVVYRLFDEVGIERALRGLLDREGRENWICVAHESSVKERLTHAGIPCELFQDLVDDQLDRGSWIAAEERCKEYAKFRKREEMKYRGISVFECLPEDMETLTRLSRVSAKLSAKGYSLLIFLLRGYFPLITGTEIRTHYYGGSIKGKLSALAQRLKGKYPISLLFVSLVARSIHGSVVRASMRESQYPPTIAQDLILFNVGYSPDFPEFFARSVYEIVKQFPGSGLESFVAVESVTLQDIFRSKMPDTRVVSCGTMSAKTVLAWLWNAPGWRRMIAEELEIERSGGQKTIENVLCDRSLLDASATMFAFSLHFIKFLDSLVQNVHPSAVVVVPDRNLFGRTAVKIARKYKVPSITLPTGLVSSHPHFGSLFADRIAIYGNVARELYLKAGVESSRIMVTGMPHWDGLANIRDTPRKLSSITSVLFATENLPFSQTRRTLEATVAAVERIGNARVVVKVHPRESTKPYEELVQRRAWSNVEIKRDVALHPLITESDLVIVNYSEVGLEAMIIGRPVIVMDFTGRQELVPYVSSGAALGVFAPQDAEPKIRSALFDSVVQAALSENVRRFINDYAGGADGKAAQRFVDVLKQMASESKNRSWPVQN